MLSGILSLLSVDIIVDVSPDRFVFKRKDNVISLKTKIYLTNDSGKLKVLGIGDEFIPTQSHIRVDLFKRTKDRLRPDHAKMECLEAYFRQAFNQLMPKFAILRPRVIYKNAHSLNDLLCGYQNSILMAAATSAGARECIFEINNL